MADYGAVAAAQTARNVAHAHSGDEGTPREDTTEAMDMTTITGERHAGARTAEAAKAASAGECYARPMVERSHSILVVEDDPAVAEGLVEGISMEGFDVHWESTGAGGVAWAKDKAPHLVVHDVRLPDGSGFDFVKQMRQLGLRQPVLMLTVQSDEIDKVLGLEMGADDYMTKPYRMRELVARIRSLLRRAYGELSSAEADVLYVDDLVVDRTRGAVTRDGSELNLTPTEFRLLTYLAQHPGQVFSRTQLLEQVWGSDGEFYSDKTVSVHVRRLREKIEHDPSDPTIVLTVPGIGYRLAT